VKKDEELTEDLPVVLGVFTICLVFVRRPQRVVAMCLFLPVLPETKEILMKITDKDLEMGRRSGRGRGMPVLQSKMFF